MSQVLVTESYISDIASAIRNKNGQSASYTPSQMAPAILSIMSAGELSIISQTFSQNGTYRPSTFSADAFSDVIVDIANTYTLSDEGKVVSNASLVNQTSMLASANSTYDTTRNNQVVVDVPNSYSASDEGKVVYAGALSIQGALSIYSNSIYDTTYISQVNVNVEGSQPILVSKTITENGTYNPADDNADAYSQVVVNVSGGGGGGLQSEVLTGESFSLYDDTILSLRSYALYLHNGITDAEMTNVQDIGEGCFQNCKNLRTISFKECVTVGAYAFYSCSSLNECYFPKLRNIINYAFAGCRKIQSISFPECIVISPLAFNNCSALEQAILRHCSDIQSSAFSGCSSLMSFIILTPSVCTLRNANAFKGTPISNSTYTGSFGSIYVPASLVSNYKSANAWNNYSDRITAYVEE